MKRLLVMFPCVIMSLSVCACSASSTESENEKESLTEQTAEPLESDDSTKSENEKESSTEQTEQSLESDDNANKLGESVETDILRITLVNAQLAIKLDSSSTGTYEEIKAGISHITDDYFTADEYDPETDVGLAYVAAKGHTYVAIEYKADNLDRASVRFDDPMSDPYPFITVRYNGETYSGETEYGCSSKDGYEWEPCASVSVLLLAGEEEYYRCYIDIPVDVKDLDDDFTLIFSLPDSSGTTTDFAYHVTAEERHALESQEISLAEAIYDFKTEEGQQYFSNHLEEYPVLTGDEIATALVGKKVNVVYTMEGGSWSGKFQFETDGNIMETIYSGETGYFNSRTWEIHDNTLILSAGSDERVECEMRMVQNGTYLLMSNGKVYALMGKDVNIDYF